jgi:protein-tyrosine-phosphatase
VVMETAQRREICRRFGRSPRDVIVLGDLDPEPIDTRRIDDPVDQGLEVFEASYARIERCVGELARALLRQENA